MAELLFQNDARERLNDLLFLAFLATGHGLAGGVIESRKPLDRLVNQKC